MTRVKRQTLTFGVLGVLAALVGIAVGTIVAVLYNEAYAPIQVVAASAIDIPPAPVKEWATATFGTSAKYVVVGTVMVVVLVLTFVAGVVARRRIWWGVALAFAMGIIGAIAGLRRPTGDLLAPVPSLIAGVAAAIALWAMVSWVKRGPTRPTGHPDASNEVVSTRRAFIAGALAVVGSGVLLAAARGIASQTSAAVSRVASLLPRAADPLPPLPPTVQAPVPGLAPFVTPNESFYRIDTAVVVPQVKQTDWTLTFDGMVSNPFTITYDDLIALPLVERDITIMCVSNPVGGPYIGNARWLGTPLMPLLEQAGLTGDPDQLFSQSIDGWTCSTPLDGLAAREPLLVIGMNGEPLPVDHGYPVRMIVPGLYGFISATKWVTHITASTYQADPAYWSVRGWATSAPVLTGSRVDLPSQPIPSGPTNLAGVAWAMDGGGVSRVEVQVDDGPWQDARLADEPNPVTWRQWWLPWDATEGDHAVTVRATNGRGEVQTSQVQDVIPAGATGYATRTVTVT